MYRLYVGIDESTNLHQYYLLYLMFEIALPVSSRSTLGIGGKDMSGERSNSPYKHHFIHRTYMLKVYLNGAYLYSFRLSRNHLQVFSDGRLRMP